MRNIKLLVIHCSASDLNYQDSFEAIRELHITEKSQPYKWGKFNTYGKGFDEIGYHYVITKNGSIHLGRPLEWRGAHCSGLNHCSIGICLTGDENFTEYQFVALRKLVKNLCDTFNLEPKDVVGHNKLNPDKTCPNFNVEEVCHIKPPKE